MELHHPTSNVIAHVIISRFLTRDGDSWHEQVDRDDQLAASLVLPGFVLRVSDFWAEIEDVEDTDAEDWTA